MGETLRLLCVLAHPDDESMGTGSTLVKYAAQGIETYLVTATRGEKGWSGNDGDYPGAAAFGRLRQKELLSAADVLGIRQVYLLDYIDGELDQAEPGEAIQKITRYLRLIRPQVVITFGPDGNYGHPDHIAISQFTTAATVSAADPSFSDSDSLPPHRVSKLYYILDTRQLWEEFRSIVSDISIHVDGILREPVMWEEWAVNARINGCAHWEKALEAVLCHQSQIAEFGDLKGLDEEQQCRLWGVRTYYRAYSLVNGGREVENDLFAGIRG
ncbi:MAG: PIG-L deacetylase family protein [Anaerolineales bacterium]